jgi:excisionase family DNA binding protein
LATKNKPQAEALNSAILLTKAQAAEYLQVTTRYIERAVTAGKLKAYKPTGGIFRIRRSDLDAFLESGASIAA